MVPSAVFTAVSPCSRISSLQPAPQLNPGSDCGFPGKLDLRALCLTTLLPDVLCQRRTVRPGPPHRGPNGVGPCYFLQLYDVPLSSLDRSLEWRKWDMHVTVFPFPLFLPLLFYIIPLGPKPQACLPSPTPCPSTPEQQPSGPGSHTLWENSLN